MGIRRTTNVLVASAVWLLLTGLSGVAAPASAQVGQTAPALPPGLTEGDSTLVDRVVAMVGDSAITMTEVLAEYQVVAQRDQDVTPEEVLEQLVRVQLVLQAAARDTTMQVPDEELDERVESAVADIRARFPSDQAYQQALRQRGMTPQQYRDELRNRIRIEQVQQMFMRRQLQNTPTVPVTEEEMRAFYEERRATLQQRPELVTLEQVFVVPTASDSAWARAEELADSLRTAIAEGADFGELAEEHSDDPGSASQGGELGWFRRGVMVRDFEQVAFELRDGQVSQPVRTRHGYHIIKTEKRRPGEVRARHILIRPELTDVDDTRAVTRAEEVVRRARDGEPVDSLRAEFGDEEFPVQVQVARDQIAQLPYDTQGALDDASVGDVVGPVEAELGGQRFRVVVRVAEIREAGEFTFDDLRDQIRQQLSQNKRIDRIYERLRSSTYVDIRM